MFKQIQLFVSLIEKFYQQRSKNLQRSVWVVQTCFQILYIKFIFVKEGGFDMGRWRNKESLVGGIQVKAAEILAWLIE